MGKVQNQKAAVFEKARAKERQSIHDSSQKKASAAKAVVTPLGPGAPERK
jgi:hypothetical protein